MPFNLSARAKIRAVSFAAAAVFALGGFCFQGWHTAGQYKLQLEYEYRRSFDDLTSGLAAIDGVLRKGLYSQSPLMLSSISAEVSRRAAAAQTELSSLPQSYSETENTAAFLSRLGGWALALNRSASAGELPGEEQLTEMKALSDMAGRVSSEITSLSAVMREEKVFPRDGFNSAGFGDTVKELENGFASLPTLIFDGPFSDHIERRTAKFLEDQPPVDANAAAAVAAAITGIDEKLLQPGGEIGGNLPAYAFTAHVNGGEYAVTVSKNGGVPVAMTSSRAVGEPKLTFAKAVEYGSAFLEKYGFGAMRERYYIRTGNSLLINYAAEENGTTFYPDLVKVTVALDDGRVEGFDATGWLMNHAGREIPAETAFGAETARARLKPGLLTVSAERCVIPTEGLNEVLCFGFRCVTPEGDEISIYVNAETGDEERILLLSEDENGTLTI